MNRPFEKYRIRMGGRFVKRPYGIVRNLQFHVSPLSRMFASVYFPPSTNIGEQMG